MEGNSTDHKEKLGSQVSQSILSDEIDLEAKKKRLQIVAVYAWEIERIMQLLDRKRKAYNERKFKRESKDDGFDSDAYFGDDDLGDEEEDDGFDSDAYFADDELVDEEEEDSIQEISIDMSRKVTVRDLSEISKAIRSEWKLLGAALGITEVKMEHIDCDNKATPMKIFSMLKKWRVDRDATVNTL